MTQLPGFKYDAKRRRAVLDGYAGASRWCIESGESESRFLCRWE
jgi:hypothetical protein